ncbi:TIGR01621 family pseudouridine synthase [Planctobacterium marinum]
MTIPVIAEHRDFFIVNKPADINVHQQELSDGLITRLKQQLQSNELWLVHRLDQITSGCLVIARNKETTSQLGRQFQQRKVTKFYLALCDKRPKKRQGLIKGDMKKIRSGKWALSRSFENPAITQFYDMGLGNGLRLQLLKPYTGQTHQLRVALNSLGSTILGDDFYGGTSADRTYLHAWQIAFELNGERHQFSCLPQSGEHFLAPEFINKTEEIQPVMTEFRWPEITFNDPEKAP